METAALCIIVSHDALLYYAPISGLGNEEINMAGELFIMLVLNWKIQNCCSLFQQISRKVSAC